MCFAEEGSANELRGYSVVCDWGGGVSAKHVKVASRVIGSCSAELLGLSPWGSIGPLCIVSAATGAAGAQEIDRRYLRGRPGGLGPDKKTLIEGFKGLSPFGPALLKVA